ALSPEDEFRAAYHVAQRTQFTASRLETPTPQIAIFGNSPWGRLFFQFKRFAASQAEFLWENTVRETVRFARTRGRDGSLRGLALVLAVAPHIGWTIADIRSLARFGERAERPDNVFRWYFEGLAWVGGFGIFHDIINAALSASEYNWQNLLLPPAASDAGQILTGVVGQSLQGDFDVATRRALQLAPVVGPTLAQGQLPGGVTIEPLQEFVQPRQALIDAFIQAVETGDNSRLERMLRSGRVTPGQVRALRSNLEVQLQIIERELARTQDPARRQELERQRALLLLAIEQRKERESR
ncbi:MAG TPA: hypothetical protein VF171_08895, partial [Trueperaceae bacterium]